MKVIDKIGYSLVRQVKNIDCMGYLGMTFMQMTLSLLPSPLENMSIDC